MSATGILPTYQRFVNGMPVPLRRSFPSRVRSVICMVVVTFCLICFTTFFYLPEFKNSGGRVESMYKVYDQIKRSGPDLLIPPPPQLDDTHSKEAQRIFRHEDDAKNDPHIIGDREKLKAKIEEDHELKVLERPDQAVTEKKEPGVPSGAVVTTIAPGPSKNYPIRQGGEDSDDAVRKKRDKVKDVSQT